MLVLLDECVPRRFGKAQTGHSVRTVADMGWSGKKNGELLQLMSDQGFEVLLTVDQNLSHQQNFQTSAVALVVVAAVTNRLVDLLPLMPAVQAALSTISAGDVVTVRA